MNYVVTSSRDVTGMMVYILYGESTPHGCKFQLSRPKFWGFDIKIGEGGAPIR